GFAAPEDPTTAVCVLPGTELAFNSEICVYGSAGPTPYKTAIFRQVNREQPHMHHDALELPDGQTLLLTFLCEGQEATVRQLLARLLLGVETDIDVGLCRRPGGHHGGRLARLLDIDRRDPIRHCDHELEAEGNRGEGEKHACDPCCDPGNGTARRTTATTIA